MAVAALSWPALPLDAWRATCDTLHAHTQVLGKLAVALAAPEPQLQHAALRLTARGWETLPLPAPDGSGVFVAALDLHAHEALLEHSDGRARRVALTPDRAVGEVTRELLDAARSLAGDAKAAFYAYAHPAPEGIADATLMPPAARWDESLGEFILDWDDARGAPDPRGLALEFARAVTRHLCDVCGWDPALAATVEGTP